MIDLYFVAVFTLVRMTPPLGWMIYSRSYSDIGVCREYVEKNRSTISLSIGSHLGRKLVDIRDIRCRTMKEAIRRNTALGH